MVEEVRHRVDEHPLGFPPAQRQAYYDGVVNFMARYFADQSRNYAIAKYEIGDAAADGDEVVINSKVYLISGQSYTVVWRLAKSGGRYKVRDAKVLGFSMVYMQRSLFTNFITKRNFSGVEPKSNSSRSLRSR